MSITRLVCGHRWPQVRRDNSAERRRGGRLLRVCLLLTRENSART